MRVRRCWCSRLGAPTPAVLRQEGTATPATGPPALGPPLPWRPLPHVEPGVSDTAADRADGFREASLRCTSCVQRGPRLGRARHSSDRGWRTVELASARTWRTKCAAAEVVLLCAAWVSRASRRKSRTAAKRGWSPLSWGAEHRPRRVSPLSPPRRRPLMFNRTRWYVAPSSSAWCGVVHERSICWGRACRLFSRSPPGQQECTYEHARTHARTHVYVHTWPHMMSGRHAYAAHLLSVGPWVFIPRL